MEKKTATKKKGRKAFPETLLPSVLTAAKAYLENPSSLSMPPECDSKETMVPAIAQTVDEIEDVAERHLRKAGCMEDNAHVEAGKAQALSYVADRLYDMMRSVEALAYDAVPADMARRFVSLVAKTIDITRWRGWRADSVDSFHTVPDELFGEVLAPAERVLLSVERARCAAEIGASNPALWLILSPKERVERVLNVMQASPSCLEDYAFGAVIDDCETALTSEQVEATRSSRRHMANASVKIWLGPKDKLAREFVRMVCHVTPVEEGTFVKIDVKDGIVESSFY
jgi:hypothetical protein